MPTNQGDLFGRGIAFPPRVGTDGRISVSAGPENIRESIRIILMTEPGETDGMSLADHITAVYEHAGRGVMDGAVVHGRPFPPDVLARYARSGARPVRADRDRAQALDVWVLDADVARPAELARHHPEKLGRVLARLIRHGAPAARAVALRA